jgi:hypothetical protein
MVSCSPPPPLPIAPHPSSGEVEAIIELDDETLPFWAEQEVRAGIYRTRQGEQLVIHAGMQPDLDSQALVRDRLALVLVLDLEDPALPGTVDLSRHTVVLMELDRQGEAQLVLDGAPEGTAEILGTPEPGRELTATFSCTVPGTDEIAQPVVARIDGSFTVVVGTLGAP